jgi:hypothetical protein
MDLINAWKMEHIYDVVIVVIVVVVVVVVHEYEVQCSTERYYCGKLYKA